jgi:hypothetical protein
MEAIDRSDVREIAEEQDDIQRQSERIESAIKKAGAKKQCGRGTSAT